MSAARIAIVGIGLRYPDANSPQELWENVLAGRRAFRRLPDERMNHDDYYSPDPAAPDRFYSPNAAVLRDFEFDRVKYHVAGSTYRSTDLTHWLALEVAAEALADAGFPEGEGLPRRTTGVVLGNSLTGEFTRANLMRLRWPYVRRTVAAALSEKGWTAEETGAFLRELETTYKAPFPPITEDTLAGGLANTISGRICNHFDLHGGGFTVDGACSSSLLSVATMAKALADRELDVALAGGVDLSIDPFEVIGFAKTGALATGEMKVYDRDSNGFWPGEGSGQVVLMREADALAQGKRIYAVITGWGISSDGKGGITRPEANGHRLALERAYRRAGYGVETVSYFEGHGTGTALGDATEIDALSSARRDAGPAAAPAALSTIKGNFGHTKAAAGVAGLIKAALAVYHQVIPPGTGQNVPHPLLTGDDAALYVPSRAELWPDGQQVRAGVSAMGFGGINSHVAIEQAAGASPRDALDLGTESLVAGRQDAELLLFDAPDPTVLRERVLRVAAVAPKLAQAELADVAGTLAGELSGGRFRAAVVVTSPDDAAAKLAELSDRLGNGVRGSVEIRDGVFLDDRESAPRLAFLFPGQGSGHGAVGALQRRFAEAAAAFAGAGIPVGPDPAATEVAQPRIMAGSVAALRVLRRLGIEAAAVAGHSLGELTALHWGGALDSGQVLALARTRGQVMAAASHGGGAMAGLVAGPEEVRRLTAGEDDVVIAGFNGPRQTVVSGPEDAVERVCGKANASDIGAQRIRVSHAFHSPLVQPAAVAMATELSEVDFAPAANGVYSTVTGAELGPDADLRVLLREQMLRPVRFHEAAAAAMDGADLVVEVGPGRVLAGLAEGIVPGTPVLPVDSDSPSLVPLLRVVGAAFALGAPVDAAALFEGRLTRPFPLDGVITFLASPCEEAPKSDAGLAEPEQLPAPDGDAGVVPAGSTEPTLDLLRRLTAERIELPLETVRADTHPLDDLHLSSITVGQLVNDVTRELGHPPLAATSFATVNIGELAEMIDGLAGTAHEEDGRAGEVPGVASWVRAFAVDHVERPAQPRSSGGLSPAPGSWTVHTVPGHPLAEPLRAALAAAGAGDGILLCLPPVCTEAHTGLILDAGRNAVAAAPGTRLVVVQHGSGAAGLARTVCLEAPSAPTTVVGLAEADLWGAGAEIVVRVVTEVAATTDYSEAHYDEQGTRTVPVLRALTPPGPGPSPLDSGDVLLVTGGGKGITAECALSLAADTGLRLALLGRANPGEDAELASNLARMDSTGIRYLYQSADVTSSEEVRTAIRRFEAELGPITAVLHGAGRNVPASLATLTEADFTATLAPKVSGLRTVLGALDQERLKLLMTFGSIIGRAGLRGEAHYATANDRMSELTVQFQREHPRARALAIEWSVWSGAGMGERLGVVEALMRDGITPISTDQGIDVLRQVLADPSAGPVVVVSGRAGGLPTLTRPSPELPLYRFVDRVLVHYPGIELITESSLTAENDPYLPDHLLDEDMLFPAVLGMEAMTQVATALTGHAGPPSIEQAEFLRPVVVRPGGATVIRLAALVTGPATVDVVIRSGETAFSTDHFRATLRFPRSAPAGAAAAGAAVLPLVPIDPASELYGGVLFQGRRFQRLRAYRRSSARHAVAEISTAAAGAWFAPFLSQGLVLADPGVRDTVMHALQCCVPDATLLPERVDRIHLARAEDQDVPFVVLDGRERSQDGDSYTYDLDVRDPDGRLVERWEGLTLRAVRRQDGAGPWIPSLLGPYLERALERVLGGHREVVVEPAPARAGATWPTDRRAQTELAASRALDRPANVRYRPDGRPELDGRRLSASHTAGLTLVVVAAGPERLACDAETVAERQDQDWAGLLGPAGLALRDLMTAESGETPAVAGTRLWGAMECLRKSGAPSHALTLDRTHPGGWAVLSSGDARIASWVTTVDKVAEPVVFTVLAGEDR